MITISNGDLLDTLCDNENRDLSLVRLKKNPQYLDFYYVKHHWSMSLIRVYSLNPSRDNIAEHSLHFIFNIINSEISKLNINRIAAP